MQYFNYLLQVKAGDRSTFQIIIWWELRRILYNIIVFIAGMLSLMIMLTASSTTVHLAPGEDFYEPILVPIFAFLCNIAYTLGWITEVFITPSSTYGPKMFKVGLGITLLGVFIPAMIWVMLGLLDIIEKLFT